MGSIHITVNDRRNVATVKSIPFTKYTKPDIQLIGVENAIEGDTIIILPPEAVLRFRATSIVGLQSITYSIDGIEETVRLNGEREYILELRIKWQDIQG
jgi:hypothetical protein